MPSKRALARRGDAKIVYDAFLARCPSRQLLDAISDKWVCLVLAALADGPLRHGGLADRIVGVSQKMLTQTLRSLERDGLLERTVTPSVPVRVDYELTALGRALHAEIGRLKRWAETNMDDILKARSRYDARSARLNRVPST